MFDPNNPDYDLIISLPTENERQRLNVVFISHSSADGNYVKELTNKIKSQYTKNGQKISEKHLIPLSDDVFIKGGDNFHDKIKQYIHCYVGVIIVTKTALLSDWVNYECGYFEGLHIPVILWDPNNDLSLHSVDNDLLNSHISHYMPAEHSADAVVERLKTMSIYSNMFKNEYLGCSKQTFDDILNEKVKTVMIRIKSEALNHMGSVFQKCKIGVLVVNFGMFYENHGDGVYCYREKIEDCAPETMKKLRKGACPVSHHPCALSPNKNMDEAYPDCIVLNYVTYSGSYYDKKEYDYNNDQMECGTLCFYLPVHTVFGTEFKFIVDAPHNEKKILFDLFKKLGFDPTLSDSLDDQRIYLSLPDDPDSGFFRLDHQFNNNFVCPYAASENR